MEFLPLDEISADRIFIYDKFTREKMENNNESSVNSKLLPIITYRMKVVLLSESDPNRYHKYYSFNCFSKETYPLSELIDNTWTNKIEASLKKLKSFPNDKIKCLCRSEIPDNITLVDCGSEDCYKNKLGAFFVRTFINNAFDPNKTTFTVDRAINFDEMYPNCKIYTTLDNRSISFVVVIDETKNVVHIYDSTQDIINDEIMQIENDLLLFNRLIASYEISDVFIGKSVKNEMTEYNGCYGDKYDGNSILVRLKYDDAYKYLYIGTTVTEFETDEIITQFASSVGPNYVTYPYASSNQWCYCMSEFKKIKATMCPDRYKTGLISYLDDLDKHYLPMENVKTIVKRNFFENNEETKEIEMSQNFNNMPNLVCNKCNCSCKH